MDAIKEESGNMIFMIQKYFLAMDYIIQPKK